MLKFVAEIQSTCDELLGECSKWEYSTTREASGCKIYYYKGLIKLIPGVYIHVSLCKVGEDGMWIATLEDEILDNDESIGNNTVSSSSLISVLHILQSEVKRKLRDLTKELVGAAMQ